MKNIKTLLLISVVCCLVSSCDIINRYKLGDAVVQVGGEKLYEEDLRGIISGLTGEDSARIADEYIKKWATEMLMYERARRELKDNSQIEAMVEQYRRMLYIQRYEEQLVRERMPKFISEDSILAFYDKYPDRFFLKDNLLKGLLLVIHKDAPDQQKLKKWLSNLNDENMENIEKYAYQYASGYELFTDQWQRQSNVLLRLPIAQGSLNDLLKHNSLIEMQDSVSTYLLQITEKKMVGDQMPIEYATPAIENTLLNMRQMKWLAEERERMWKRGLEKGEVIFKERPGSSISLTETASAEVDTASTQNNEDAAFDTIEFDE